MEQERAFTQETLKRLAQKYPWLDVYEPYYETTNGDKCCLWIEFMPIGWQKRFGLDLIRDLAKAIEEDGLFDAYKIYDVKEKFGRLCWYDNGGEAVEHVINKYEIKSEHTCVECGDKAKYLSMRWICPYCEKCKKKNARDGKKFIAMQNTIRNIGEENGE